MNAPASRACIIGHPIAHSLSPVLHRGWLQDLGLTGDYQAWDVAPDRLGAAIERLKAEVYRGANITIPHKQTVRALLDHEDESARAIGAVNTLVVSDGRVTGSNTDAFGYIAHLTTEFPRWRGGLHERPVLVLGAGGAARGAIYGLARAGAARFLLTNRTQERATRLAADFAPLARIEVADWSERSRAAAEAGLIINATSLGMKGAGTLEIDLSRAKDAIVSDLVYNPLETRLLQAAKARGLATLDGLGMLIHQGRPGFRAWFGAEPPVDACVRGRLLAALAAR